MAFLCCDPHSVQLATYLRPHNRDSNTHCYLQVLCLERACAGRDRSPGPWHWTPCWEPRTRISRVNSSTPQGLAGLSSLLYDEPQRPDRRILTPQRTACDLKDGFSLAVSGAVRNEMSGCAASLAPQVVFKDCRPQPVRAVCQPPGRSILLSHSPPRGHHFLLEFQETSDS